MSKKPCRFPGCRLLGCIYGPHEQWSRENPEVNNPLSPPVEAGLPEGCPEEAMFNLSGPHSGFHAISNNWTCEDYRCIPVEIHPVGTRARLLGATGMGEALAIIEALTACEHNDGEGPPATTSLYVTYAELDRALKFVAALRPRLPAAREGSPQEQKDKG